MIQCDEKYVPPIFAALDDVNVVVEDSVLLIKIEKPRNFYMLT